MTDTTSIIVAISIALFLFLVLAGMNVFLYLHFKRRSAPIQELLETPQERKTESGFPPGSIGDVSSRIGYDVRDVLMAGFTHAEINEFTKEDILGVMHGEYSLKELRERKKS